MTLLQKRLEYIVLQLRTNVASIHTLSNLVYAANRNYIVFDGIDFEGANTDAFYLGNFSQSTIQNCNFDFNYNTINGTSMVVHHQTSLSITARLITLIITPSALTVNLQVQQSRNNVIKNSGILPGMSGSGDGQAQGLNVMGNNYLIQYNEIDSTGYVPLGFNGSNITM